METTIPKQTAIDFEYEISFFEFRICVIGLDEAGINLAHLFSSKYLTIGFDESPEQVKLISENYNYNNRNLKFTSNPDDIRNCNFYVLSDSKHSSYLKTGELIGNVISKGDFVVVEQEELEKKKEEFIPVIENVSGLKYDEDFFGGKKPVISEVNYEKEKKEVNKIVTALFSSVLKKGIG